MLSPFCYYNTGKNHWWVMICGLQFIYNKNKFRFRIIKWNQWGLKVRIKFKAHKYSIAIISLWVFTGIIAGIVNELILYKIEFYLSIIAIILSQLTIISKNENPKT